MIQTNVFDRDGNQVGSIELREEIFGIRPYRELMHAAVVSYQRNNRQGNACTKIRGEVRGGGAKPWRQKGTGRARSGSSRSPVWKGGGVTFGPRPRAFNFSMNRKSKRLAMASALSVKTKANSMVVIDSFNYETPKTANAVRLLKKLEIGNALIILGKLEDNTLLSFRNIPHVSVRQVENMNVYEILKHEKFIATKEALRKIEEVFIS
ncbi:MAG: 50S ribosomal protein L4 [Candidatus Wallbacteria bacterium]|nr:50S ribosomal protein L4 [Candidatus Wallbacteria bacterium]